jgi:hypothetical protein
MKTTCTGKKTAAIAALISSVLAANTPVRAASCHVYRVDLQGVATIGDSTATLSQQQFAVQEYAVWRSPGFRTHQVEFWLTTGQDLNASAQLGQIELMTNTRFANNAGIRSAQYDLGTVSVTNVVNFQLDSGASFQLPSPNVFVAPGYGTAPGGLGGLCFLPNSGLCGIVSGPSILNASFLIPRNGSGYFYTPNGNGATLAGEVNLVGSALDNANFQGQYKASFSGNFLGDLECN